MPMSNVWFTSDLHLGHPLAAKLRGFDSVEEHDGSVVAQMGAVVGKRDKLFILGDVVWNNRALKLLKEIPGVKELVIGNHDSLSTREYMKYFVRISGFRKYKNFWLSHCPIHPQELYRCKGNLHGHLHNGGGTPPLPLPYFNVNVDYNEFAPVNYDEIVKAFKEV